MGMSIELYRMSWEGELERAHEELAMTTDKVSRRRIMKKILSLRELLAWTETKEEKEVHS